MTSAQLIEKHLKESHCEMCRDSLIRLLYQFNDGLITLQDFGTTLVADLLMHSDPAYRS